jgi:hypothetical protein
VAGAVVELRAGLAVGRSAWERSWDRAKETSSLFSFEWRATSKLFSTFT